MCVLQDQLAELKKSPTPPVEETMTEYNKKIAKFLKGLIQAEKLPSPSEKATAKSTTLPEHPKSTALMSTSKEIHLKVASRYTYQMRNELLGEEDSPVENGVRHRRKHDELGSGVARG